jgi:hypothetical protein
MDEPTTAGPPDRLLDAAEAARKLGVGIDTLRHWHARGFGPAVFSPTLLAYLASDIEDWLDRLGMPAEPAIETVWRQLPNGCTVVRVLTESCCSRVRFEIRRGRLVVARFASLPGLNAYLSK